MDALIAQANIAHLRERLSEPSLIEAERERMLLCLAREQAKLFAHAVRAAAPRPGPLTTA